MISRIVDDIINYDVRILFCADRQYYAIDKHQIENVKARHMVIENVSEAKEELYDSLHLAFKTIEELEIVKALLKNNFEGEIEVHHNVLNLDITPFDCSKGKAIRTLDKYLPVKYEDIYVIGDSYNDISMFEAAKTAFSFHRSDDIVKAKATHLVDDIAEAIKEMNKNA